MSLFFRLLMVGFTFSFFSVPLCFAAKNLVVGDFSGSLPDEIATDWQPLIFDGVDKQTMYMPVVVDGAGVIQAESRQSSSGFVRKMKIDVNDYPILSFRWKIANIIQTADLTRKSGDDAPARVYVSFAYDSAKVGWWEMVKFETIRLFYGEYPPIHALTYVWGSHAKVESIFESPYTSRVKIIVLESGETSMGQWRSEQRNIKDDYQQAFGSNDVPMISGVAIMTDTDNTGEEATAWYGDIIFSD